MPALGLRRAVGALARLLLAVYFRRIERYHLDRIPAAGPVLIVANHPGSVTDALVLGTVAPRVVHFVGTVALFRLRPVAWLLHRCGIIPVNRRQDDPARMATVAETFAACHRVFEAGGAVAIFPEGVTYDDARLREIRTGAARLSLDLEDQHDGRLGLLVAPVGLTYSAKDRYRSDVLVHAGEAFPAADFLAAYRLAQRDGVQALRVEIERRLRALIIDLPSLEHERIVEGVKRLYLERLRQGNLIVTEPLPARAEELVLGRAIGDALAWFEREAPDRVAAFAARLRRYERTLGRFRLSDDTVAALTRPGFAWRELLRSAWLVAAAPAALYGWVHRFLPLAVVRATVGRVTASGARRAQTAHASMLAGLVAFGGFYAGCIALAWRIWGPAPALWYGLTLAPAGLFAHVYARALAARAGALRTLAAFLVAPVVKRRLVRQRARLVAEIDRLRARYREAVFPGRDPAGRPAAPTPSA